MINIDLLIEKDTGQIKLSEYNLLVQDIEASSPSMTVDRRTVKNRSGVINAGAQFVSKTIKVAGSFYASSLLDYENRVDELNALLIDLDPYYITKMIPINDELYKYQIPGETTNDLNLLEIEHEPFKYRYKVQPDGDLNFQFNGKSDKGLFFKFTFYFITAEMPFGETIPKTLSINSDSISYDGTAKNSQLEYPWTIKLVADTQQPGTFTLMIGSKTFSYSSQTDIQSGDIFLLKGIETTKNGTNVNNYTNREHFVLEPRLDKEIPVTTNFQGTIQILNFVEFYK